MTFHWKQAASDCWTWYPEDKRVLSVCDNVCDK